MDNIKNDTQRVLSRVNFDRFVCGNKPIFDNGTDRSIISNVVVPWDGTVPESRVTHGKSRVFADREGTCR